MIQKIHANLLKSALLISVFALTTAAHAAPGVMNQQNLSGQNNMMSNVVSYDTALRAAKKEPTEDNKKTRSTNTVSPACSQFMTFELARSLVLGEAFMTANPELASALKAHHDMVKNCIANIRA